MKKEFLILAIASAVFFGSFQAEAEVFPITKMEIVENTVLLGTSLDNTNNRLGFQLTCDPKPKITFHLGFYPSNGKPVSLVLQHSKNHKKEIWIEPHIGGSTTGFFSPTYQGREAKWVMEMILTHDSITGNGAGTEIIIPQEIEIEEAYKVLRCIAYNQ